MTKRLIILLLATVLVFSLVGCSFFSSDKDKTEEKIDELPEEIVADENFPVNIGDFTISKKPQRIVVLSGAIVEKLMDMGIDDSLVGVSSHTKEAGEYTSCGTGVNPDIPAIIGLNADLLITEVELSQDNIDSLLAANITVLQIDVPTTVDQLWQNYKDIALGIRGKTAGEEIASTFVGKADYMLNSLKSGVAEQEEKSVLYVRGLDFTLATGDSLVGDALTYIGFKNIAEQYTNWNYPKADAEKNVADFKSVDFYIIDESEVTIKDFERSMFYKGLSATLKDRYVSIDYLTVERSGLGMLTQLKEIVEYAYPDAEIEEWNTDLSTDNGGDEPAIDPDIPEDEGAITDPE